MESFDRENGENISQDQVTGQADGKASCDVAENTDKNTVSEVTGAIESEKTAEAPAKKSASPVRKNEAQILNEYLFEAQADSGRKKPFKDNVKSLAPIWRFTALALLLVIVAFSGALFGIIYVCESAVYKDSEFFDAFMAKWSGVTENRIEVDYVSGEYSGDAIALADKALSTSIIVRTGVRNGSGTFIENDSGSGVLYAHPENTDIYYVVTNHHVVYDTKEVLVEVYDKSVAERDNRYLATIKYLDETSDLAILEFECERDLPVAAQSDSSKVKAGQNVIVAGNPLGHGFAVALGYVSNPSRVSAANNYVPRIVMDVSVNPGNSGGGLYDSAGNLLGIVTSKANGDSVDGIGYAVPINTVNEIVNDLLTYGYVRGRAAIGLETVGIFNPSSYFEYENEDLNGYIFDTATRHYGVYVTASGNALIKKGDRIISVDGQEITANADIQRILLKKKPGNVVTVMLESSRLKDGETEPTYSIRTVTVLLVERTFSDPATEQEKNNV